MKTAALNLVDVPCQMLVFAIHGPAKGFVPPRRPRGLRVGRAQAGLWKLRTEVPVNGHSKQVPVCNLTRGYKLRTFVCSVCCVCGTSKGKAQIAQQSGRVHCKIKPRQRYVNA